MLLDFLRSIAELVSSVLGMVFHTIEMFVMMLLQLPKAISYIFGAVAFMPPFVSSVILVSIGIAVIITVVNHWGN